MKNIFLLLLIVYAATAQAGEIALTFDDAPMGNGAFMSGAERTTALIKALKDAGVDDVLFFSNSIRLNDVGQARLQQYADAGHHIASHSHSHRSASKIGVEEYLKDIDIAHQSLSKLDNFLPYHRFPYLNHGKDEQAINTLQEGLTQRGYKSGYVTVDNFDFYLNHLISEAKKNGLAFDLAAAEALYVETLWQAIEFYDALALRYIERSPKHVLLLHENDAAAMFIPALVKRIKAEGWKIISPQSAYTDPIAKEFPKGNVHNQGRVAAIARSKGASEEELRQSRENTEVLDALFAERVVNPLN